MDGWKDVQMSRSVKSMITHRESPQTSSRSMLCPSSQAHHRHYSQGSHLYAGDHSCHEAQRITGEVSHQPHAPFSASQSWDSCSTAPYNSVCSDFPVCALGRNKAIKSQERFLVGEAQGGIASSRSITTNFVRCALIPHPLGAGVGGHLPTLATVYW